MVIDLNSRRTLYKTMEKIKARIDAGDTRPGDVKKLIKLAYRYLKCEERSLLVKNQRNAFCKSVISETETRRNEQDRGTVRSVTRISEKGG